jgi:hypothetical protein
MAKAGSKVLETIDARIEELKRLQAEVREARAIAREERAAWEAIMDEVREAARVGQHLEHRSAEAWPRWQLANRNLETLLERLATDVSST